MSHRFETNGDICFLVSKTHGSNESLVLDGSSSEVWSNERWLGDHALPSYLKISSCSVIFTESHGPSYPSSQSSFQS